MVIHYIMSFAAAIMKSKLSVNEDFKIDRLLAVKVQKFQANRACTAENTLLWVTLYKYYRH